MRAIPAILACLAATSLARAAGPEVISPAADSISVTIYRDLFALVTETRTVDLPEGPVTLSFDGVVETLLPTSTVVADTGRTLEERNYDYDQLTPSSLFRRSVGREVLLTRTHERSGKVWQVPATIVSADQGGVVLKTRGGHEALYCAGLADAITFEKIPEGLRQKPRLSIQLGPGRAGKRTVHLSYLAQGFAWKSDYVARLGARGDHADLTGWVTLRNLTNTNFRQAEVLVVAGKLNLLDEDDRGTSSIGATQEMDESSLREAREEKLDEILEDQLEESEDYDGDPTLLYGCFPRGAVNARVDAIPAGAFGKFEVPPKMEAEEIIVTGFRASSVAVREELADYQLYRLPWPTDLNARQTKQAVFLDKHEVKVERFYSLRFNAFSHSDDGDEPEPELRLGFENRKSSGLGEPLPEGVLRLFEPGPSGDLFAGEGTLADTSVSEPVEIPLAHAIDLAFEVDVDTGSDRHRLRDSSTEIARAQVRIANAKGVPVTVEIRQEMDEYLVGAKISRASHRTLRKFGDYAWRIRVPANSADTLDYEIRYTDR